jgi:hypothetical protein
LLGLVELCELRCDKLPVLEVCPATESGHEATLVDQTTARK